MNLSPEARRVARRQILDALDAGLPAALAAAGVDVPDVLDGVVVSLADRLAGDALDELFETVLGTAEIEARADVLELPGDP